MKDILVTFLFMILFIGMYGLLGYVICKDWLEWRDHKKKYH